MTGGRTQPTAATLNFVGKSSRIKPCSTKRKHLHGHRRVTLNDIARRAVVECESDRQNVFARRWNDVDWRSVGEFATIYSWHNK